MTIHLRTWGDLACFTRPEMKVERVSYPIMTPSAARGLLEAILFRPQFRWRIRRIAVKQPIRFLSFRRNEVKSRLSVRNPEPLNAEEDRTSETHLRCVMLNMSLRPAFILLRWPTCRAENRRAKMNRTARTAW